MLWLNGWKAKRHSEPPQEDAVSERHWPATPEEATAAPQRAAAQLIEEGDISYGWMVWQAFPPIEVDAAPCSGSAFAADTACGMMPHMTLEQLRVFVAVAERQHVTRAAASLNLTQSAASAA